MTAFHQTRLGEISQIYSGFAFRSQDLGGKGIPVVKIANIQNKRVIPECVDHFPEELLTEKLNRFFLQPNDTLVAMTGAGSIGKIGKMPCTEGRFLVNQRVGIIRPDGSKCDPAFVYFALSQDYYETKIYGLGLGAGQPNVSAKQIGELEIPLPPLPIQCRIAGILSAYDELIENSQRRIKILESMARALYREWFVHFRFPGNESRPFLPSPLEEIPKGWEMGMLGDLCELRKDAYKDSDHSGLPLLDMAHMPSRTLAASDTGLPSELTTSRIIFQKGDTLFGAIRCYLHKVIAAHLPGVTNTSVLVLRPKSPSFRALVAIVASDIETIRWAETQSTGTKMPVINWGVFQGMPAPIPTKTLAQKFEDIAGPMLDEIGILATQIQILRRTRDLLLPRLLSGQIDVEAMPS